MTEIQVILVILGCLAAFAQVALAALGIAIMLAHKVPKVKISLTYGYISAALFIAAVLL